MCLDHPNRSLANGPNHPGPCPEEIPMVDVGFLQTQPVMSLDTCVFQNTLVSGFTLSDSVRLLQYISKNVPATERVMRSGMEASFVGSHHSSRSHNSSTRAHSSTHRYSHHGYVCGFVCIVFESLLHNIYLHITPIIHIEANKQPFFIIFWKHSDILFSVF